MNIKCFCNAMFLTGVLLCAISPAFGSGQQGESYADSPAFGGGRGEPDAGSPVPAQPVQPVPAAGTDALDAAIREASTYLNGRVPTGSKAVFLNIKSDYPDLSEYILSILSENAVNDGEFSVVDRQQLDTIRAELNFQMSGEVSDESAQNIGQMLGAQSIVSGSVSKIGSLYRVQVKAIEVQSAGVQGQWSRNIPTGPTIAALTERYAPAPAATAGGASPARSTPPGGAAAQTTAPVATPAQTPAPAPAAEPPAPKTYKIGDTGPGGGIVFYDKGVVTNGWRYMEAAPATTETTAQWRFNSGPLGEGIPFSTIQTSKEVGMGQANTQTIMRYFGQNGGGFGLAVQICDELAVNGFEDWFLPSLDELNYMYGNLYRRALGGFRNEWYYSSTIISGNYSSGYSVARINFANGEPEGGDTAVSRRVRAARRF
jgi:hypothetical protein